MNKDYRKDYGRKGKRYKAAYLDFLDRLYGVVDSKGMEVKDNEADAPRDRERGCGSIISVTEKGGS
jgi:hypothetical protein